MEQLAVKYFREGIELSYTLLNGGSTSGSGWRNGKAERSLSSTDALDIPAVYNQLGLVLRDAGIDPYAEKEAFMAGLLTAPDNFALLVNGGAAHQAGNMCSFVD